MVINNGVISQEKCRVHLSSAIFDIKGNFHHKLANIIDVHLCKDIRGIVKKMYEGYLNSTCSQVPTVCKIFFVYEDREDIDYVIFGKEKNDKHQIVYQAKSYDICQTIFRSEGDGKIIEVKN